MRLWLLLTAALISAPVQSADLKQLAEQLVNVNRTGRNPQTGKEIKIQWACRVESLIYRRLARLEAKIRHYQRQEARWRRQYQSSRNPKLLIRLNLARQAIKQLWQRQKRLQTRIGRAAQICHGSR